MYAMRMLRLEIHFEHKSVHTYKKVRDHIRYLTVNCAFQFLQAHDEYKSNRWKRSEEYIKGQYDSRECKCIVRHFF